MLPELPLTPNGKIDRRALPQPSQGETKATFAPPSNLVEEVLAEIWNKFLELEQISVNDNFFEVGGNSLLAIQLVSQIRKTFDVELPLQSLFEFSTVRELAKKIENIRTKGVTTDAIIDLNAEAVLDPTIGAFNLPFEYVSEPACIFLTGATGFLGAFLLYELLNQTKADIYCLVRSANTEAGKQRLQKNLESYLLWDESLSSRIIPVLGDLSKPLLGLSASQFQSLANSIDVIYHNGALVNFSYPYQALKATNVIGTQEVLRLASQIRIKPLHFISTTDVFASAGYLGIKVIEENVTPQHNSGFYLGYTQSKWVAEQLIEIARSRGLPISVYRPSSVVGHSQTGAGNAQDFIFRMIQGCIQVGQAPDIDTAFNIAPVDYVSQAIVCLSRQQESRSQNFHVVNPHHVAIHWSELSDWISSLGYSIEQVSYQQWEKTLNNLGEEFLSNPLYPLMPLFSLAQKQAAKEEVSEHQLGGIQFDCQNTLNGLSGTSISCPLVNAEFIGNNLSYFNCTALSTS